MGNFTINAIFAVIFGGFAWNSLPRGWRYFKIGWLAFRVQSRQADDEIDVEKQREQAVASSFLLAGIAWLIGGLVSAALTLMFVLFAILNVGIFNFIS